jgi:hypothetical protein
MFGEWITEEILYPLPHWQYVFTLPTVLRPYFTFDRKLLGKLSQCAYQSLKELFQKTLLPCVVLSDSSSPALAHTDDTGRGSPNYR